MDQRLREPRTWKNQNIEVFDSDLPLKTFLHPADYRGGQLEVFFRKDGTDNIDLIVVQERALGEQGVQPCLEREVFRNMPPLRSIPFYLESNEGDSIAIRAPLGSARGFRSDRPRGDP